MHFTPTSGSWLNMVEIFFGIITRQAIRRGTFTSVKDLIAAIETFIDGWNERCQPFTWTKTADQILDQSNRRSKIIVHTTPGHWDRDLRPLVATALPAVTSLLKPVRDADLGLEQRGRLRAARMRLVRSTDRSANVPLPGGDSTVGTKPVVVTTSGTILRSSASEPGDRDSPSIRPRIPAARPPAHCPGPTAASGTGRWSAA